MIFMEISSSDFMKLNINEVSDLLLSNLSDSKGSSAALLCGVDQDGRKYNLSVKLELVSDE